MISVDEALERIFALVSPLQTETVSLRDARGRVLAEDAVAQRDQPPFSASAMDGYAVHSSHVAAGATFRVVGQAAAGHAFEGQVQPGEALRIFTGAPVPPGLDRIIIQEDVARDGDRITLKPDHDTQIYIRARGNDFAIGNRVASGRLLRPSDISLLAAMNVSELRVTRRPVVAILATGDELVMPGETPREDQIIASNGFGLAALIEQAGGIARLLPIARDNLSSLQTCLKLAQGADLLVTSGGASVGDHDLLGNSKDLGLEQAFYKVAMRPGKPLMAGTLHGIPMIGLPGNPVSSMVCGHIFMLPALHVLQGLAAGPAPRRKTRLAQDIPANGPREHYMRAFEKDGAVTVHARQDSALQSVLADANALLVRPPYAAAQSAGELAEIVPL